jgi:hypothetical protein
MANPPTPKPDSIRLTITVSPEVHEAFSRMAQVSGMSLGRCMGEWLGDTLEGVQLVTHQMQRAREAPREMAREMRQAALGILDEADDLVALARSGKLDALRELGRPSGDARSAPRAAGTAPASPRLVIRGGKSHGKTRKDPGSKGGK